MSLDLTKVASQVAGMVSRLKARSDEEGKRLSHALEILHDKADNIDSLRKKILSSKTTWLVADLLIIWSGAIKPHPSPTNSALSPPTAPTSMLTAITLQGAT